jgi:Predicted hydrolase (metallo-beta-lactamase superfamily)
MNKSKQRIELFLLTLMLSFTMLLFFPFDASAKAQKLEITWLNVGQGDCAYLELPNGNDILIDGGRAKYGNSIVSQLNNKEKNMTLEAVINTHPDADHSGGLQVVFSQMKVKAFYYPGDTVYDTITAKDLMSQAKSESGCKVIDASAPGKKINGGKGYIKFIQGSNDYSGDNEDSLMVYIHYNKFSAGIFGDVQNEAQCAGVEHNLNVVEAPHHGSKYSSSAEFIKRYDPENVVISVGKNSYGHPNPETLSRYKSYDSKMKFYRTDTCGNITLKTNGKTWKFSCSPVPVSNSNSGNSSNVSKKKTVYITATGKKYHYKKNCRGLSRAKNIYKTTLGAALGQGLSPCSICAN